MTENGDKSKRILDGIQLTLAEIRDLRADFLAYARKADEDRKRADEDRKRADEDRRRADERFRLLLERFDEERERSDARFDRLMRGVVHVGQRIVKTQEEHTKLLRSILKTLRAGTNGRSGNGSR